MSELFDELLGVFLCELEGVGVSGVPTENGQRHVRRPPEAQNGAIERVGHFGWGTICPETVTELQRALKRLLGACARHGSPSPGIGLNARIDLEALFSPVERIR